MRCEDKTPKPEGPAAKLDAADSQGRQEAERPRKLSLHILSESRRTLAGVLSLAVLVMMVLPFWATFQDWLTRLVMNMGWYRSIQDIIVPYELRIVGSLLAFVGMPIRVGQAYIEWTSATGVPEVIYLAWNCVGWQTLVLFVITLVTGLSGKHTILSKLETLFIGIMGTYLVNILRLVLVVVVYFLVGRPIGIVFHDYFSGVITLLWLFLFWWFAYKHVLVPLPLSSPTAIPREDPAEA